MTEVTTSDVDKVIACLMPAQVLMEKLYSDENLDETAYQLRVISTAFSIVDDIKEEERNRRSA